MLYRPPLRRYVLRKLRIYIHPRSSSMRGAKKRVNSYRVSVGEPELYRAVKLSAGRIEF